MNDKESKVVSNFYGRARRLALAEKIIYTSVAIFTVILVIFLISKTVSPEDKNINFAFLRDYWENKGFGCSTIQRDGGTCSYKTEGTDYLFVRLDDGFKYTIRTNGYIIDIVFTSEEESITFKTNANSLAGYRDKTYLCSFDSIVGEVKECLDSNEKKLDANSYIGAINKAMFDLNKMVEASGYSSSSLLRDHKWEKK